MPFFNAFLALENQPKGVNSAKELVTFAEN